MVYSFVVPSSISPARPGLGAALASLRGNRRFQFLWLSNLFFFGGVWTQTLVLGWLAFELTHSEFLVAVYTAVRLCPLLLGPFGGVLADRHNRVRLLLIACSWAATAVAVVAVLASWGLASYPVIVLGGLAIGLSQSPSQPARASLVLELVGRENLSNANALNALALNTTQVIGPALGGVMIAGVGAPAALWISTGWYVLSLLLLIPLRRAGHIVDRHTSPPGTVPLLRGFALVLHNPLTVAVLLVTLAANVLIWPIYQSFMPVFAGEQLGLDAAGLGALLTCAGIGGLIGSLVIAGLGDFRFKGGLFVIGTGVWGLAWTAFALSHSPALSFLLMAVIGLCSAAFGVLQTTLLLMTSDRAVHGRALGLQELAIGIMPASTLVLGLLAQQFGVSATTAVCGSLLALALALLALRVPRILRYDGRSEQINEPAVQQTLTGLSQPLHPIDGTGAPQV